MNKEPQLRKLGHYIAIAATVFILALVATGSPPDNALVLVLGTVGLAWVLR